MLLRICILIGAIVMLIGMESCKKDVPEESKLKGNYSVDEVYLFETGKEKENVRVQLIADNPCINKVNLSMEDGKVKGNFKEVCKDEKEGFFKDLSELCEAGGTYRLVEGGFVISANGKDYTGKSYSKNKIIIEVVNTNVANVPKAEIYFKKL